MGILIGILLALLAPDSAPATAPRPTLPFGTGQFSFVMRSWSDSAFTCEAAGSDPQFAAFATGLCENFASDRRPGADAAIIGEVLTIVATTRAGEHELPVPAPRGRRSVDVETEVELAQDGRVIECRIVRETIDPDANTGERRGETCNEMKSGPPVFGPAGRSPAARSRSPRVAPCRGRSGSRRCRPFPRGCARTRSSGTWAGGRE